MTKPKATIPLCRSEFLQDVSIELGRRLKALRCRERDLEFCVRERDDEETDQFSTISSGISGSYVQIVICDDKRGNYVRRDALAKSAKAEYIGYKADLSDKSAVEIALLIRDSLYGEKDALELWRRRDALLSSS